jgi:hypothetical protein
MDLANVDAIECECVIYKEVLAVDAFDSANHTAFRSCSSEMHCVYTN